MSTEKIIIKLIKSRIGTSSKQKKVLESLGIRKINQVITHNKTPEILGMIKKVKHLIKIENNTWWWAMQYNKLVNKEKKQRKRVGRGNATGNGTYSGKGLKGQKSRSGFSLIPGFEGGQLRLIKKLAKLKGFKNHNRTPNQTVTLDQIDRLPSNIEINNITLFDNGLIENPKNPIKILNVGKLSSKRKIQINKISESARKSIVKSGSEIIE